MKIQLDRKQLLAALCTSSTKDIRYYLNGVFVEASGTQTRLTATDGKIASTQRFLTSNDIDAPFSLILPDTVIKNIKGKTGLDPWLEYDGDNWALCCDGSRHGFTPIDGTFPEYRRIIPSKTDGTAAQYQVDLLARFNKAASILGKGKVWLKQNGTSSAYVGITGQENYIGVIMPYDHWKDRNGKRVPEPEIQSWAREAVT